jgi:hypothetical protein
MAALALQPQTATAQETNPAAASAFSFAVYGDSRSMMYLPYKSDQEADARQLMVDMFDLVLPEKVAAEVIQKDVKLTDRRINGIPGEEIEEREGHEWHRERPR